MTNTANVFMQQRVKALSKGTSPSKKLLPIGLDISGVKRCHRLLCPFSLPLSQVMHGDKALSTFGSMKLTGLIIFLAELSHFSELLEFHRNPGHRIEGTR